MLIDGPFLVKGGHSRIGSEFDNDFLITDLTHGAFEKRIERLQSKIRKNANLVFFNSSYRKIKKLMIQLKRA